MIDFLLDLVFPPKCLNCGDKSGRENICKDCFLKIPINKTLFCGKCFARIPASKKICHQNFPYLLGAAASYDEKAVKNLILALKFKFIKSAALPLGNLLANYFEKISTLKDEFAIIPIPLSRKRQRQRGFNQSELIADAFAAKTKIPLKKGILTKIKETKPQTETKSLNERLLNVQGCFRISAPEKLREKNIILIDDVTTSGATFLEAATVLKKAGVKKIIALAAARA